MKHHGTSLHSLFILLFMYGLSNGFECDFHATMIRSVEKEGFHKELRSLVEIVTTKSTEKLRDCQVAIEENLPSSFYVDPDQLNNLGAYGKVVACANETVDVEKPQFTSPPLKVYVYSSLNTTGNLLVANLVLPIHLRYHKPRAGGGYEVVKISKPRLFLRCPRRLDCPKQGTMVFPCYRCSLNKCSWLEFSFKTNMDPLKVTVPVGDLNHKLIIQLLTFLVTIGGSIYIFSTLASKIPHL
ncbi:phosphatidylinositol-glycan biosynthesis class X protein-like [Nilaparvata lugens]|uniref:phosphatidylinositol-glycan biosynthesis class X protein-like n=1 Tax=Nilaparvata lugens TaxID=108931 RepID=UPI00193D60CD|nr:phosphatidylinositol-glycan biosynthesis class X protein-like [Nilaparvata lugens]